VTIPHKEKVIPFLDTLDDPVREIGAVNTIKIYREGRAVLLKGYNTDVFGFASSLYSYVRPGFKNALILGTGGASKAVIYVLKKWGLQVTCVSRSPKNSDQISYSNVTPELIRKTNLIVNTTPAGMYPEVLGCPEIPYEAITSEHVLFDLIYNPEVTMFMEKGKLQGAIAINGMGMLYKQADKAWEIWNSEADTSEISMP
jgi:shikimate dehydrogenase